ncbi:MAG: hypothetical protein HeimC2_15420 [Candidatus Heimdallarchaeota archaeon LC_2]|nr:MAG: hypothetical protein HeimC2_15420 [Candidatus Heimdallarchaeota archaeon LC_2]
MSRRKIYRREDKQISFFTSLEMHEAIKFEAKRSNTSIKDYLINLHNNATNDSSSENLIADTHTMVKKLFDSQAFLVVPQQTNPISMSKNKQQNNNILRTDATPHRDKIEITSPGMTNNQYDQSNKSALSITFSPQLDEYLSNITRSSTYETMKRIILALIKLKEATHYQINQEIGHTSHNQPRALKRAVEDKIVLVDEPENPKEPYYYRLNPVYLL